MSQTILEKSKPKRYWLSLIYLGTLLAIVSAATMGLGPRLWGFIYIIPLADKLAHLILIAGLALSLNVLFGHRQRDIFGRQAPIICLWLAGIVAAEECSQIFIATRTFDVGDLVANWTGIAIVGLLATRHTHAPHS